MKLAFSSQGRKAAEREIETMSQLAPHPNCLSLLSAVSTSQYTMLVTPLAVGGDTLQLMRSRHLNPLPEADARLLFGQLVSGLRHMHRCGYFHQDIKCENILLSGAQRRQLVIADFGFAAPFEEGHKLELFRGSLHYSAPEILSRTPYVGPATDVWSAGVVLYAWVTGRLPFGGTTEEDIAASIKACAYNLPHTLSNPLRNLFTGILQFDPAKRFSMDDVASHPWLSSEQQGSVVSRHTSHPTLPMLKSDPTMPRSRSSPHPDKPHFLRRLARAIQGQRNTHS